MPQGNTKRGGDITNSIPYGRLIEKRAALEANLANLKITLRDKNPKVIKAKNDIKKVNDEIEGLKADAARRAKTISARRRQLPHSGRKMY